MISNEIVQALKCSLKNRDHFLIDAHTLKCGHNICNECLELSINKRIECSKCNQVFNITNTQAIPSNPTIPVLMQKYEKELRIICDNDCNEILTKLDTIDIEKSLDQDKTKIQFQIDERVNELKNQLDVIGDEMRIKLEDFQKKLKEKAKMEPIDDIQNGSLEDYQKAIKKMKKQLNEMDKNIPKLQYKPSELEINEILIGELIVTKKEGF